MRSAMTCVPTPGSGSATLAGSWWWIGGGRRLFELLPSRIELGIVRVIDTPEATHIRYRVRR
jgi:hypothetical protein